MPDTQQEVLKAGDTRFRNRTEWLVKNRQQLDLRWVAHTGDVVNWDTPDHSQYKVAQDAFRPLEQAGIPYSLSIGNHDTQATGVGGSARDTTRTRQLVRDTSVFNQYFTAKQYGGVSGQFEANKVDNAFSVYEAGGLQWMVVNLELWPRPEVVTWAKKVVADHPKANVIVTTHDYLNGNGQIEQSAEYGSTSAQYLFDNLISQYANIRFVFSGHVGMTASRTDTGKNGNKIYSFLQTLHDNSTNPVRLVEVDTKANTVKTWIYSPFTNQSYPSWDQQVTGISWVR